MATAGDNFVVLVDTFTLFKKANSLTEVKIDNEGLSLTPLNKTSKSHTRTLIKSNDLVGSACYKKVKGKVKSHKKEVCYFSVYFYLLSKGANRRVRHQYTFEINKELTFQGNINVASKWKSSIHWCIHGSKVTDPRKLLIFINPNSGPGQANQIFRKHVVPVLEEAEVPYKAIITERAEHAKEFVQDADLTHYRGIVIVSGDGLIFEVYNGLFQRKDWKTATSIPLGIIPGGSGNGLARSIAHYLDEPYSSNPALVSALNIIKTKTAPMDLVKVHTADGQKLLSFLSLGMGILSDIDIESERLRMIGESRFTVWSLLRIACLRKYKARVSYKRTSDFDTNYNSKHIQPTIQRSQTVVEDRFSDEEIFEDASSNPYREGVHRSMSDSNDPRERLSSNDSANSLVQVPKNKDDQDHFYMSKEHCYAESGDEMENNLNNQSSSMLDQPIPEDWEVKEDEFVLIYAAYQTHIGSDILFAPKAKLDDGIIWLILVPGDISKASLIKFLLSMGDGSHLDIPGVEAIPVTDFRIEPLSSTGFMTVDGEEVKFGPIQASVLPAQARLLVR